MKLRTTIASPRCCDCRISTRFIGATWHAALMSALIALDAPARAR